MFFILNYFKINIKISAERKYEINTLREKLFLEMLFTFLATGRVSICTSVVFKCEKKKCLPQIIYFWKRLFIAIKQSLFN